MNAVLFLLTIAKAEDLQGEELGYMTLVRTVMQGRNNH